MKNSLIFPQKPPTNEAGAKSQEGIFKNHIDVHWGGYRCGNRFHFNHDLAYLIPAVFAELATGTGFYYSKAKAENRIKLRKLYGPEIYNDAKEP